MTIKQKQRQETTAEQRKLLFESWEKSKNVSASCVIANVGRTTFYKWKPRFIEKGYAGLENCEQSGVAKGTGRVTADIENKVVELHRANASWGKRRLADEMTKANNWVPLVSLNCVRRILMEAGMWKPDEKRVKKGSSRR